MYTYKHVVSQGIETYCSKECQQFRYHLKCENCGIDFWRARKATRTCSRECQTQLRRKDTIEIGCAYCKKLFVRDKSSIYTGKESYCSNKCKNNAYSIKNPTRYGGEWNSKRLKILTRDSNKCLQCGSMDNLEVHHFIKVKEFDDPNEAHYDDNLGVFCRACHREVEDTYKSLSEFKRQKI